MVEMDKIVSKKKMLGNMRQPKLKERAIPYGIATLHALHGIKIRIEPL
jgi:hypothetical protein